MGITLQESGEMYLETILRLKNEKEIVRSIDVAKAMNYTKPSVSRAMSRLKEENYIVIKEHGAIHLTEKGRAIAEAIYERHQVISNLLIGLGVDEATAVSDACRMEHVISDTTFACLKKHMSNN